MSSPYRYRSFFWPALLILAGLIALLVNTGAIAYDRLVLLFDLWPLILIVIGLEIIVRRSLHGTTGDLAAALIVVVALVGAVGYVVASPNPGATHKTDFHGAAGGAEQGGLEVDAGAATVTISAGSDLGSDLYHAHVEYSGPAPAAAFDSTSGNLKISQQDNGFLQNRKFTLSVQLNPNVPWTITLNSAATTDTINVPAVHVSSIRLNTAASRSEITLGTASGIVPITIDSAATTVRLHLPSGTEASVAVSGAAVSLSAPGKQSHAIGTVSYETPGFTGASNAYRIEINGAACNVSLDYNAPSG